MDTQALLDLAMQHKWVAFSALLIGFIVRLFKSDTPLPTIPPAWRPWFALGLGVASGVLDKVVSGTPWQPAILGGLLAAMAAIVGHETVVESVRNGREFFVSKPPSPPSPPSKSEKKDGEVTEDEKAAPVTMRKKAPWSVLSFSAMLIVCWLMAPGCKDPKFANEFKNVILTVEQVACVLVQAELGTQAPAIVSSACAIAPDLTQDVAQILTAHQKAKAKLISLQRSDAGATSDASVGANDAGNDAGAKR